MRQSSATPYFRKSWLLLLALIIVFSAEGFAQKHPDLARLYKDASARKGKRPVIIIPGILGSELINEKTGEKVWFRIGRSKDDDLRLPIAGNISDSRDALVPGDIIRKLDIPILSDVEVYQQLINALERYGGYTFASWDDPPKNLEDKYFIYSYDWRRDNVETARTLFKRVAGLKKRLGQPGLKFNIIAHSMGGLVARYAAMYGDRDISPGTPKPDWAGDAHFAKIFLFGTPNEGSADALQLLLEGYGAIPNINLPFVRDLTPVELITMPSTFQLLPHQGTFRMYDENLQKIDEDIFDPKTWRKYGWSIYGNEDKLLEKFSEAEVGRMENYFEVVLKRARDFHTALDVKNSGQSNIAFFIIGSDCVPTLDGAVIYMDTKKERWVTLTKKDSFRRSDGEKVRSDDVERVLYQPGDGRVTRRSLLAETLAADKRQSVLFDSALPLTYALFACEEHDKLTGNPVIQDNLLTALISEAAK
jgi:pimeloyl-ACP methyl ester carboxylesterase